MLAAAALASWTQPSVVLPTVLALCLGYAVRQVEAKRRERLEEPSPTSPLLSEHFRFVQINGKQLRIVHIPHELGSKVPLLVFIHGVGGQVMGLHVHGLHIVLRIG